MLYLTQKPTACREPQNGDRWRWQSTHISVDGRGLVLRDSGGSLKRTGQRHNTSAHCRRAPYVWDDDRRMSSSTSTPIFSRRNTQNVERGCWSFSWSRHLRVECCGEIQARAMRARDLPLTRTSFQHAPACTRASLDRKKRSARLARRYHDGARAAR